MGASPNTADEAVVELKLPGPVPTRLRVHGWARGLLVERLDDDTWESLEGDPGLFRLVSDAGAQPRALEPIRTTIPASVQAQAARFGPGQLVVLRMLQSKAGDELVRSAPTLAWLVACRIAGSADSLAPLPELVGRPRRELLAFALSRASATAAMVRSAARVVLQRYDAEELAVLRALLVSRPALDVARRHHRWELLDLRHAVRFPCIAERPYSSELLDLVRRGGPEALLHQENVRRDTQRMARVLDRVEIDVRLESVPSLAALTRLHDALLIEYNAMTPERRLRSAPMPAHLPAPPLPGDGRIEPLRTPEDYLAEGRTMGHCVASYVYAAARGACAVYRVEEPERATVEIKIRGSALVLGQIRGRNDRLVAASTRAEVERWFEAAMTARARDAAGESSTRRAAPAGDEEEP